MSMPTWARWLLAIVLLAVGVYAALLFVYTNGLEWCC
jgi:hypothetical protein